MVTGNTLLDWLCATHMGGYQGPVQAWNYTTHIEQARTSTAPSCDVGPAPHPKLLYVGPRPPGTATCGMLARIMARKILDVIINGAILNEILTET